MGSTAAAADVHHEQWRQKRIANGQSIGWPSEAYRASREHGQLCCSTRNGMHPSNGIKRDINKMGHYTKTVPSMRRYCRHYLPLDQSTDKTTTKSPNTKYFLSVSSLDIDTSQKDVVPSLHQVVSFIFFLVVACGHWQQLICCSIDPKRNESARQLSRLIGCIELCFAKQGQFANCVVYRVREEEASNSTTLSKTATAKMRLIEETQSSENNQVGLLFTVIHFDQQEKEEKRGKRVLDSAQTYTDSPSQRHRELRRRQLH